MTQVVHMSNALILLAGGNGSRFGSEKPKQLVALAGKPIIEHTLSNVVECEAVDQIIIVSREEILGDIHKIVEQFTCAEIKVVPGGETRTLSSLAGLSAIEGDPDTKVLIHDVVRPFVSHKVLKECFEALDTYDAVDVVIPSSDTLVEVESGGMTIKNVPMRSQFRRGQTPQGFRLGKLVQVMIESQAYDLSAITDDCGLYQMLRPGERIGLVTGDESNIKVTHPLDLVIAEQLVLKGALRGSSSDGLALPDGMKCVIFGDTSGLGFNLKSKLEQNGAEVFGASRSTGCDIGYANQVENVLERANKRFGKIDAVLNFAGRLQVGEFMSVGESEMHDLVRTNYIGSLNVARASYPFLKRTAGQLMLVSSSSFSRGRANYVTYSSAKAAVVNMTQALSEEWAAHGIRVNCIVPRRANTPMRRNAFPNEDESLLLQPNEVSAQILPILSSGHTGMICHVN